MGLKTWTILLIILVILNLIGFFHRKDEGRIFNLAVAIVIVIVYIGILFLSFNTNNSTLNY